MHQIYDFLMESQFFDASRIAAQQQHQLELLVRFARHNVEFYKSRLDPVFNRNDEFDYSRWQEVPILRRQDLLNHGGTMWAKEIPAGHGALRDTSGSGSMGKPVYTKHNGLIGWASKASIFRSFAWHKFDYSRNFFSWMTGIPKPGTTDNRDGEMWGPSWMPQSASGKAFGINQIRPPEMALEIMRTHAVAYADGRPHNLHALADCALASNDRIRLDAVYTFGTRLSDEARDVLHEAFGAKVINRYSTKEAYDIAIQCPECNDMHVNAELMLVEVLNQDNKPCEPGEMGRIIVTPFYNTIQPFIRYDLGDYVTLGGPCECGRALPVIKDVDGRTVHAFRLPDGRKVVPRLSGFARDCLGAAEWQIAQTGPEVVEMRYVKKSEADPAKIEKLTEAIRIQLTRQTQVLYRPMAALPITPSGKIIETVCELPPENH